MPYSGPSDESIPDNVPESDKAQWVEVWNSTYNSCIDGGGSKGTCETKAFKAANGVIKERSDIMPNGLFGSVNELFAGIKDAFKIFQQRAVSISAIGNEVFEQFYNQGAWLNDLYLEDGAIFAVASEGGKLFRASIDIDENGDITLGEMQEVITNFEAVSRVTFDTTDNGKVRMLAVSATSVINRNGAIDSQKLFDSMSDYIKKTGKKIPRTFFHAGPEFRTGDIIWMGRDENVLLTLTEFDDSELAIREVEARTRNPEYWGDSIEFLPVGDPEMLDVGDGITIPVYETGIPVAVSTLAAERACSLYANKFAINRQEVKRMALRDADRIDLIEAFNGDEVAVDQWLEDNVSPINREIADTGLVTREDDAEPNSSDATDSVDGVTSEVEPEAETTEPEAEPEEEPVVEGEVAPEPDAGDLILEFDDAMAQQVADTVVASSIFTEFKESVLASVTGLETLVKELTSTVGELQAVSVARTKEINELKKGDAEKKKIWLEDLPRNTNRVVTLFRPSMNGETQEPQEHSMQETADETLAGIVQ